MLDYDAIQRETLEAKFVMLNRLNQCVVLTVFALRLVGDLLTDDEWRELAQYYHEGRAIDAARFDRMLDWCCDWLDAHDQPPAARLAVPLLLTPGGRPMLALAPCKL